MFFEIKFILLNRGEKMFQYIKKIKTKLKTKLTKIKTTHISLKLSLGIFAAGAMLLAAGTASAFIATPTAGTFAYDIYDVAVNQILNGPIGFTGGAAAMVLGGMMAIQQKIALALPCLLGGAMLMTADTMTSTLGAIF